MTFQKNVMLRAEDYEGKPPYEPKIKGETVMLPDGLWLLHLIEKMREIFTKK
ncbi:MAG: hypothetical protein QXL51_04670 [Candidatus Aenigmatarchaeota archaeon]